MSQGVVFEKDPETKIATITLNRPEQLNATTMADLEEINGLILDINRDDDVKVVIFKGNGPAFCSGHDMEETRIMYAGAGGRRPSQREKLLVDYERLFGRRGVWTTIATCWKGTIAQVHGYCYGQGLYLAMAADMIIAAENSLFTHPGWLYMGPISTWQLIMHTGLKKAKEMMLTGRVIEAQEAYETGLINRLVPLDKLEAEVREAAVSIAQLPLDGIVLGKVQFETALDAMGMHQGYVTMAALHTLQTNLRFEPGEFNLVKELRDKGSSGAFRASDAYYKVRRKKMQRSET